MNPVTQRSEADEASVTTRYTDRPEEAARSINIVVRRDSEFNYNVVAQEKAITLADEGKAEAAAQILRQSAEKLRGVGKEYDDKELLRKAGEMEQQAGRIEAGKNLSTDDRKQLRAESYQMKNQQKNQ
jgi:hypothetical protein